MTVGALGAVSKRSFWQRLVRLNLGLAALGLGIAFMLDAGIGLGPWTVFHQGVSLVTGLSFGRALQGVGLVVLLLSVVLTRTRPGLGTALNMLLVGPWVDAFRALPGFPHAHGYVGGIPEFLLGLTLQGLGTGLYIAARFGAGPRDGLVLGLARMLRLSVRLTRTGLELVVLATGWAMGGQVGLGTVLFALGIGPLMQLFLRAFATRASEAGPAPSGLGVEPIRRQ